MTPPFSLYRRDGGEVDVGEVDCNIVICAVVRGAVLTVGTYLTLMS